MNQTSSPDDSAPTASVPAPRQPEVSAEADTVTPGNQYQDVVPDNQYQDVVPANQYQDVAPEPSAAADPEDA